MPARSNRAVRQPKTPRTRSKFRIIEDPIASDRALKETLKELGLVAAHTLGDGNCLFRALSDQLYGEPTHHFDLRHRICDYIQGNEAQYKAFVDDPLLDPDQAFAKHVALLAQVMRQNATYGSHLEISAFARMTRRIVKVIQPSMIYVVGDADESPAAQGEQDTSSASSEAGPSNHKAAKVSKPVAVSHKDDDVSTDADVTEDSAVYIIYHSWEHYSSARNIDGPHSGLPKIKIRKSESGRNPPKHDSLNAQNDAPTAEEKLVLSSLPTPSNHTLAEVRSLIDSSGSWERALEILLERDQDADIQAQLANTAATSSSQQSNLTSTEVASDTFSRNSQSVISNSPVERPHTPKRALSESISKVSLASVPASRRMRMTREESEGASLSASSSTSETEEDRLRSMPRSTSPMTDVVSEFDDDTLVPSSEQDISSASKGKRVVRSDYQTRSKGRSGASETPSATSKNMTRPRKPTGREKKEAARTKKREERTSKARLKQAGKNAEDAAIATEQTTTGIRELYI